MANGVSKKLFITVVCVQAIVGMAEDAEDKLPYAIVICVIFGIYKLVQGWIDKNSN